MCSLKGAESEFVNVGIALNKAQAAVELVGGYAFGTRSEVNALCSEPRGFGNEVFDELSAGFGGYVAVSILSRLRCRNFVRKE